MAKPNPFAGKGKMPPAKAAAGKGKMPPAKAANPFAKGMPAPMEKSK